MSLTLVIGPMFSGKSNYLIKKIREIREKNIPFFSVSHILDKRYGENQICSHDRKYESCFQTDNIYDIICHPEFQKAKYVFIEEAQFFEHLVSFIKSFLYHEKQEKHFIVAGLQSDYMQNMFPSVVGLIPIADKIKHCVATCNHCGKNASFTRLTIKKELKNNTLVGGSDIYESVCRFHSHVFI